VSIEKMAELLHDVEARYLEITNPMNTKIAEANVLIDELQEMPFLNDVPEEMLNSFAVVLVRGRHQGEARALQFIIEWLEKVVEE